MSRLRGEPIHQSARDEIVDGTDAAGKNPVTGITGSAVEFAALPWLS
jgi:hypothetical protein